MSCSCYFQALKLCANLEARRSLQLLFRELLRTVSGQCRFPHHVHVISLSSPFHVFESVAGIDPKVASKFFGGRFACGSSVTGDDEIVIQGDVGDDLYDVIPEKWPEVSDVTVRFHA